MTRLVWRAGNKVIEDAQSQKEKERAYKLVAATLLKALRVSSQNAIFNQERDIFSQERDGAP